jgi:hypothetical protein
LTESVYDSLVKAGVEVLTLPLQNVVLVTAFGRRSKKIKTQALVAFDIGKDSFESVFMVSPQLANDAILGCQFLGEYGITIDFKKSNICYVRGDKLREYSYNQRSAIRCDRSEDRGTEGEHPHPSLIPGQGPAYTAGLTKPTPLTPDPKSCGTLSREAVEVGSKVSKNCCAANLTEFYGEADEVYVDLGQSPYVRGTESDPIMRIEVKSDEGELKEEVLVSQSTGYYKEAAKNIDVYVRGVQPYLQIPSTAPGTEPASPDQRALRKSDLSTLVVQNTNLTEGQKRSLFRILEKYVGSMTT